MNKEQKIDYLSMDSTGRTILHEVLSYNDSNYVEKILNGFHSEEIRDIFLYRPG